MIHLCSPFPWSYEFSPYALNDGSELPAFEVFDDQGNKVFDTNEDASAEQQEANAMLGAAAPALWQALQDCIRLLADFADHDGEEGLAYHQGLAALALCSQPLSKGDYHV